MLIIMLRFKQLPNQRNVYKVAHCTMSLTSHPILMDLVVELDEILYLIFH